MIDLVCAPNGSFAELYLVFLHDPSQMSEYILSTRSLSEKGEGGGLSAIADSQKKTHLSTFVEGTLDFRNQFWVLCRIHLHHHIANTYRLNTDYFALSICIILSIHWAFIPSWTRSSSSESDQPALDGFNVAPSCFKRLFACLLFAAIFY